MIDNDLIQKNLQGHYQFNFSQLFRAGLDNSLKHFFPFLQMIMIVVAVVFVVFFLFIKIQGISSSEELNAGNLVSFQLAIQIVLAPFVAGLKIQGIRANLSDKLSVQKMFNVFSKSLPIIIISVFASLLTGLGLNLLIIPGVYIYIATGFAVQLAVDKGLTPFQAIILSIKMVNRYLPQFFIIYLVFAFLFVLAALSYGIGLVLVVPFYHIVKGALYRDLFGYGKIDVTQTNHTDNESTFDA